MHKQIELTDLKPNPFRLLNQYPLDPAKVNRLRSSIRRTGFWDNVVARQANGHYELAQGHHRIAAARAEGLKTVSAIIRELDDATMLAIMAADNDEAFNLSPGFILETVTSAKSFFQKNLHAAVDGRKFCYDRESPEAHWIHTFLDWPQHRVRSAIAQIEAVVASRLSHEAIKALPTEQAAERFSRKVKMASSEGKAVQRDKQERIAREIAKNPHRETELLEQIYKPTRFSVPKATKQAIVIPLERKIKGMVIHDVALQLFKLVSYKAGQALYRQAASEFHPDRGQDSEKMVELNILWRRIEREVYEKR